MLLLLACAGSPEDTAIEPIVESTRFEVTVRNPATVYPFIRSGVLSADRDDFSAPIGDDLLLLFGWEGTVVTATASLYEGRDPTAAELRVQYWTPEGEAIDFFEDPGVVTGMTTPVEGATFHVEVTLDPSVERGSWFVHHAEDPLALVEGLAELADSDPSVSNASVAAQTGLTSVFGPGIAVVHAPDETPFFTLGEPDPGLGLEALAEDGNPLPLGNTLVDQEVWPYVTVYGPGDVANGYSPIEPGLETDFGVRLVEGQVVSVAFMFSQSNDVFLAGTFDPFEGLDPTMEFTFYDAGTEENQEPGIGSDQGPRQTGIDTGVEDADPLVRLLDDRYTYPAIRDFLAVTLERSGDDTGG